MSLLANLRKKQSERVATATHATFATHEEDKGRTVAGVATVAVANATEAANETPADKRMAKVIDKLQADPELRYAIETHIEVEPEAVILTLAIRGKGACELRIPKSRYDAFTLLELVEKHTARVTLQ